jgi:hypothetical protein
MSITDFVGTTLWCQRCMKRNGLFVCTETTAVQEDDFSGSDDDFLGIYVE